MQQASVPLVQASPTPAASLVFLQMLGREGEAREDREWLGCGGAVRGDDKQGWQQGQGRVRCGASTQGFEVLSSGARGGREGVVQKVPQEGRS